MDINMILIVAALAGLCFVNFCLYAIDKMKARIGAWRIPERVLLGLSLLGGGIGGAAAMLIFRHKTKHFYFVAANFVGVVVDAVIIALLLFL